MAHILDLAPAFINRLQRAHVPQIVPRVWYSCRAKLKIGELPNGDPIFSAGYFDTGFDLTRYVKNPISISQDKTLFPTTKNDNTDTVGAIRASEVTLTLTNPVRWIAAQQSGAMLDPDSIEQGEIQIFAKVDNLTGLLPIYRGKVIGLPVESDGETVINIRDSAWDVVSRPVVYERWLYDQYIYISPTTKLLNVKPFTLDASFVSGWTPAQRLDFHEAIGVFVETGEVRPNVTNSDDAKVDLNNLFHLAGAPLGRYTIEFTNPTTYRVTYPDNNVYTGTVGVYCITPYLWISPTSLTVYGDPTGVKIEWHAYLTVTGNPGTLIKFLLDRAYTGTMASGAISGVPTFSPSLPINWTVFNAIEAAYVGTDVYVSETNANNEVFSGKGKPLNYLTLAQRVADHIGVTIYVNPQGEIDAMKPGVTGAVHPLTDEDHIISTEISGAEKYNYTSIRWGYNPISQAYGASQIVDERSSSADIIRPLDIFFPYFKPTKSDAVMPSIIDRWTQKIRDSRTRIVCEVRAGFGLMASPGDVYWVNTGARPGITGAFEVISVRKTIGERCVLEMAKTTSYTSLGICNLDLCNGRLCDVVSGGDIGPTITIIL